MTTEPAGVELTVKGFEQAQKLVCEFEAQQQPPSLIVTSSYIRTKQTAEPIIKRFPYVPHEEWPVHEFTYLALTKNRYTTREERRPDVEAFWQRLDPNYCDGAGAESFIDFIKRAQTVVNWLEMCQDEFIAIFSHEQFIRAVWWLVTRKKGIQAEFITTEDMQDFKHSLHDPMPNATIWHVPAEEFCSTFSRKQESTRELALV